MARDVEGLVDQEFPHWFEFGIHSNGNIDIAEVNRDIACNIPKDEAAKLMARHNELHQFLIDLGRHYQHHNPEAFKRFWFHKERISWDTNTLK